MKKFLFFINFFFTKFASWRIVLWILSFVVYPTFFMTYLDGGKDMKEIVTYEIESKHQSYKDGEKVFNFNISGNKTIEVSEESYNGCYNGDMFERKENKAITDIFFISGFFVLLILLTFGNMDEYNYDW